MSCTSDYSFGHFTCEFKTHSILIIVIFLVIIGFDFLFVSSSLGGGCLYIFKWPKFKKVISSFIALWTDNSTLSYCSWLDISSPVAHASETGLRMSLLFWKLKF